MSLFSSRSAAVILAASAASAVAACGKDEAAAPPSSCNGVELVVAASDYGESLVCGAPGCERSEWTTGAELGRNPSLAVSNGRAFFVARLEDRVYELDPTCGTLKARYSVHQEDRVQISNVHDVAASPTDGTLFAVLYDMPRLAILTSKGEPNGAIDLAPYDDDGNPQADAIQIVSVGGTPKAFVTLERLDDRDFRSRRPSKMLRIDVATRTVEAVIELAGRNPFNPMSELGGALYLAEPGNFNASDEPLAGIERFDTVTSTTRLLVNERDLGGSVSEVAVTSGCGAAIVAGPEQDVNPTSLVSFDPVSGEVYSSTRAPLLGPTAGYDLQALAWRGDLLYVGDRRPTGSGFPVHVFEREPGTCKLHEIPARTIVLPQRPVALRPSAARIP